MPLVLKNCKENIRSLQVWFLVCGLLGLVSKVRALLSYGLPGLLDAVQVLVLILFLFIGVRFRQLIKAAPRLIEYTLLGLAGFAFLGSCARIMAAPQSLVGELIGLAIALLFLSYLFVNIRRIAKEGEDAMQPANAAGARK